LKTKYAGQNNGKGVPIIIQSACRRNLTTLIAKSIAQEQARRNASLDNSIEIDWESTFLRRTVSTFN
jgi:hypothetical protein